MALEARKRQNESASGLMYRFTKKMKQSGVLTEMKKRRFQDRSTNRNKRRKSAIYKAEKRGALERARKLGIL